MFVRALPPFKRTRRKAAFMANKQRGQRALQGDGENFTLELSSNAIATAEEELGYGISVFIVNLQRGSFSIRETRIILWAALLKHHGPLSIEDAGEIMDDIGKHYKDTGKLLEVLAECINDALPFADEKDGGSGNAGKRGEKTKTSLPTGRRKRAGASSPAPDTEQD